LQSPLKLLRGRAGLETLSEASTRTLAATQRLSSGLLPAGSSLVTESGAAGHRNIPHVSICRLCWCTAREPNRLAVHKLGRCPTVPGGEPPFAWCHTDAIEAEMNFSVESGYLQLEYPVGTERDRLAARSARLQLDCSQSDAHLLGALPRNDVS